MRATAAPDRTVVAGANVVVAGMARSYSGIERSRRV
jgi:hypothetical protein